MTDHQLNELAAKLLGSAPVVFQPSTNIADAFLLMACMESKGLLWRMDSPNDACPYYHVEMSRDDGAKFLAYEQSPSKALTVAAVYLSKIPVAAKPPVATSSSSQFKTTAEWVLTRRKEKGWSQQELASRSGISIRTVTRLEAGGKCSKTNLRLLSFVLDGNIEHL